MNYINLVALGMFVLIGTFIAILSRRMGVKSASDYYVAGGRMGALLATGTYAATTYSAFMMIGLVGLTFQTGIGALGFELIYLVATVFMLSTLGLKIWSLSRARGWISPSQMIGDLYQSKTLATVTASLYLFAMLPYTVAQIQGLGILLQISGLEYMYGVILGAFVIVLWILLAGIWSVASTDLYQGLLMLTGGVVYLSWMVGTVQEKTDLWQSIKIVGEQGYLGITSFWSPQVFLAYTIPWIFFAITNPQVVSRLYVHKNSAVFKRSVVLFSIYGFIYTLIAVGVGILARVMAVSGLIPGNLARDAVTPHILSLMSPVLSALISVSIMAAAISTANSIVLTVSSSIFKDILNSRETSLRTAFLLNLVLTMVASALALLRLGYIVDLSVLTSVILLPLAPITIVGVLRHGRPSKISSICAVIAIVIGSGIAMYSFITIGALKTFFASYLYLPLSAWVLIISTIIVVAGALIDERKKE
ncbi:MAG: sodium:solute symporter family protein [Thermosphaera sp.]